ncbi:MULTISPECIES: hypothetical protein [Enterococcus]|uniref:hypothetical protein n=1 Tax=Enterococcus TaxID=1350 RepID=UPI000F053B52|nr:MULTISPECIES: hypothetical protein [Enterococcus]KAF1304841.1 hypothetical protein BAU16_01330 [Enterococcus sp. JM9B]
MNKLTNKDFYFCYNGAKTAWLKQQGFNFITHALTIKSNQEYWLFERSQELKIALKRYNDFFESK